jgi:hypothetical protein
MRIHCGPTQICASEKSQGDTPLKSLKIIPLVALLCASPLIVGAAEKKAKRPPAAVEQPTAKAEAPVVEKMSQEDVKAALNSVDGITKNLDACQSRYQLLMTAVDSVAFVKRQTHTQAAQEMGIPGIMQKCIDAEAEKGRDTSNQLLASLNSEDKLKAQATEAVAQWTTALGTTATPDFAAESGKFKNQAEALKAQLSLLVTP